MQPMFDAVNQLYTDAKNDDELRCADLSLFALRDYLHPFGFSTWFSKLDTYLRRVLQEPGVRHSVDNFRVPRSRLYHPQYIMKESADRDGRQLMDQGKRFWDPQNGKYAAHKDALFDTTGTFFQSYADDELNVQLGEDVKKLTKDLLMDGDGNLKYKVRWRWPKFLTP